MPGYTAIVRAHQPESPTAGKYDIYVYAENGELILFSNQGYENRDDAVTAIRNIFDDVRPVSLNVYGQDDGLDRVETLR